MIGAFHLEEKEYVALMRTVSREKSYTFNSKWKCLYRKTADLFHGVLDRSLCWGVDQKAERAKRPAPQGLFVCLFGIRAYHAPFSHGGPAKCYFVGLVWHLSRHKSPYGLSIFTYFICQNNDCYAINDHNSLKNVNRVYRQF